LKNSFLSILNHQACGIALRKPNPDKKWNFKINLALKDRKIKRLR